MMTATDTYSREETGRISFMRWVFRRGNRVLTCEIMISGAHAFDVYVLPSWHRSEPVIERYHRFSEAVQRQAEMARCFRNSGWALVLNDDRPIAAA
jgi:hypothetical protein